MTSEQLEAQILQQASNVLAPGAGLTQDAARRRLSKEREPLSFRADGSFTILQIADIHWQHDEEAPYESGGCQDLSARENLWYCSDSNSSEFISLLIAAEDPDLLVFTGDNIWGGGTDDDIQSMFYAFNAAIESNIPWAAVLGNHDAQASWNRTTLMTWIESAPGSVSSVGPDFNGANTAGNYVLDVRDGAGSNTNALAIYMVDSRDYNDEGDGYGFVHADQVEWLQSEASSRSDVVGLSYFHIPMPEYQGAWDSGDATGNCFDEICVQGKDAGFYEALVEAGVVATGCGHDHNNDFCANDGNIAMCYGGGVGYEAYGQRGFSRRARTYKAQLGDDGTPTITTYKRLDHTFEVVDSQSLYPWDVDAVAKN